MIKLPRSRNENIVVQNVKDEVLIYDLSTNKAFCLNETLSIVFSSCDGATSFDELKRRHKFTDDLIYFALDELQQNNLLAEPSAAPNHFAGFSRREAIRRVGLATMIALPVIAELTAPKAADAASAAVNKCQATSCRDGGPGPGGGCNPGAGCGTLGYVCCSDGSTFCVCTQAASCASVNGQVCP